MVLNILHHSSFPLTDKLEKQLEKKRNKSMRHEY